MYEVTRRGEWKAVVLLVVLWFLLVLVVEEDPPALTLGNAAGPA